MTAFCSWSKLAVKGDGGKEGIHEGYLHSSKDSQSVAFGPWDQEFTTWAASGLDDEALSLGLVPAD